MTPSNTPITPEIENIADNQGNKHTVIPSYHTHAQSEVAGLETFMSTRSHKIDKSQGNTYAYVDAQSDANTGQAKIVVGVENSEEIEYSRTIAITWANIKNLERALLDPDTTPTASSDKLVTSGGVAAALAAKMDNKTIDSTPTANSTNLVTSGGVAAAIKDARKVILNSNIPYVLSVAEKGVLYTSLFTNRTGAAVSLSECFDISGLPTAERNIFFNVAADSIEIANNETFGVRFLRTTSGVFVWYDGLFEY